MGKTKAKKGIGMIFKPAQLGLARLDAHELEEDKKACRKIGPCGVGKKALYLNSFYIDRRYYLPYGSIARVFKRVAMLSLIHILDLLVPSRSVQIVFMNAGTFSNTKKRGLIF